MVAISDYAAIPKISGRIIVARTNYSSSQKTRLNDLSHGIKIWTEFSLVLSQCTRLTDRRTDGQTEFSSLDRVSDAAQN